MDDRDESFLSTPEDRGDRGAIDGDPPARHRWGRWALGVVGAAVLVGGGASALAYGSAGAGSDAAPAGVASTAPGPAPADPSSAPTAPAVPAPADRDGGVWGAGALDRWLGGDRRDHDDHDGSDGSDDAGKVRGTLTAVDGSALTVATPSGESTLALDTTTDVVRDHRHVDLGALATGQDVVVVPGPGGAASQVIVLG